VSDIDWSRLLAGACAGEGLTSHYQPIVDVARGVVVGYEALVRFVDAPVANPELWFEAAREHGVVAELEAAALTSALQARRTLPANTFLTVNLGPDVLDHPLVQDVLGSQGSLAGLVVELTEHAKVESYVALEPTLDRLRGDGALIALDDAGSGYAGLSHMLNIRPAFIKLDRQLICGLDRDEAKQALVEMMGTLGSRLDSWLLAEGVETRAELDTLGRLGVPLVQGFHLARPAPAWAQVDDETAVHLLMSGQQTTGTTLRSLLSDALSSESVDAARGWFEYDPVEFVVIVDRDSRPTCTLDSTGMVRSITEGLRFNLDTPVAEAAMRAVTRPASSRGGPLVCIDNAGRFVGIVRMENIVKTLAQQVEGTRAPQQRLGSAA
jgi:EAL domain-containing protein (putative c-di-GMP-specific phosphodiesterase class I)